MLNFNSHQAFGTNEMEGYRAGDYTDGCTCGTDGTTCATLGPAGECQGEGGWAFCTDEAVNRTCATESTTQKCINILQPHNCHGVTTYKCVDNVWTFQQHQANTNCTSGNEASTTDRCDNQTM